MSDERGEVRLVAISRDEVENGTYVSIAERFENGITEEEALALDRAAMLRTDRPDPYPEERATAKLRAAFTDQTRVEAES